MIEKEPRNIAADIIDAVDQALATNPDVDHITVAGNGEPTMHPAFAPIAEGLFHVRARRAPGAKLALLSNGSTLNRLDVVYSLAKFDVRSMKLDAGDATDRDVLADDAKSLAAFHLEGDVMERPEVPVPLEAVQRQQFLEPVSRRIVYRVAFGHTLEFNRVHVWRHIETGEKRLV